MIRLSSVLPYAMDEAILCKLGKVAIETNDGTCILLDDEDIRVWLRECQLSLYAYLLGGKDINLLGFQTAMEKSWNCDQISIKKLSNDLLHIFIQSAEMVEFVLNLGSWNFEHSLILLRPWTETFNRSALALKMESFSMLACLYFATPWTWE